MLTPLQRLKVISICAGLGALVGFIWCMTELPSSLSFGERVKLWTIILGGPVSSVALGIARGYACLGLLPSLLAFAHPVKPTPIMGWMTALGVTAWLGTGWITLIDWVWGG